MKILFLHLSDAHFRENTRLKDIDINAMVDSLSQMGEFNECVIVFSGDIVQSGEVNQYKRAGSFIGTLAKQIKDKYALMRTIPTLIVPGNHDNLAENPSRDINELKGYFSKKNLNDIFYNELDQLKNFYEFSSRNCCYSRAKVIDIRPLTYGKFKIKVNLINSAPFSLLCNGNEDKGLHYFPQEQLAKLDYDYEENYTISIIHHGPEWFEDSTKRELYNKLNEKSDLIFVGHEHFSITEKKTVNNKHNVDISSGVALYGTSYEQGFNALVLDIENRSLVGRKFIYNKQNYKSSENLHRENIIFRGRYKFTCTEKFMNVLESDIDEREGEPYSDYFVFPTLQAKDINDDLKNYSVTTKDGLYELLNKKNRISIEGGNKAGKTLLSKYLCKMFLDEYVPVYLKEENFGIKDDRKVIKYALKEQYGDDVDDEEFWQLDVNKRVLIVDDYNQIQKDRWSRFWEENKDKFKYIILFCGIDWSLNLKEKAIEELSENGIFYLQISPFYYLKREELIRKICSIHQEGTPQNIESRVRKINDEITSQIKHFQLSPDFIHRFVEYSLSHYYTKSGSETNVFSKVFEANITTKLVKNTSIENIEEILIALDHVAHYVHKLKQYQISYEQFAEAVQEYNNKYDNSLRADVVCEIAIKSKIIRRSINNGFKIEFCDTNLLAYFAARYLNRIIGEGMGLDELEHILDNVCFRPNGDIVLFLTYITSNVNILGPILQRLENHMKEWEELDLDKMNIGYLSKVQFVDMPKLPSAKEKQEAKEHKDDIEREVTENRKEEGESLYSYDESQVNLFGNKILKGIHYLELVSKIMPNFRHMLLGEQKKTIVKILYEYPNKLLYFMLKDIDENYQKIIDDILESIPKTKEGKLMTKGMVMKSLQNQSVAYILSVYDFIASIVTSNTKTISDLNKIEYFDYTGGITYRLQNLLMEENVGDFNSLSSKSKKMLSEIDADIAKQMLTLIVRKYFLYHEVQLVGEAQQLIDVFFGNNKGIKKDLQLIQAKNMMLKK